MMSSAVAPSGAAAEVTVFDEVWRFAWLEACVVGSLRPRVRSRELFQCGVSDPEEPLSPVCPRPASYKWLLITTAQVSMYTSAARTGHRSCVGESWEAVCKEDSGWGL